jgi:hypothetical protein
MDAGSAMRLTFLGRLAKLKEMAKRNGMTMEESAWLNIEIMEMEAVARAIIERAVERINKP